jgi:hypothetical protein
VADESTRIREVAGLFSVIAVGTELGRLVSDPNADPDSISIVIDPLVDI